MASVTREQCAALISLFRQERVTGLFPGGPAVGVIGLGGGQQDATAPALDPFPRPFLPRYGLAGASGQANQIEATTG